MIDGKPILAELWRDRAGNILPIAAAGMVVAAMVVGSAVDLSRDYRVHNQLQAACDAGVLAGRRTVTTAGYDEASKKAADGYFWTNYDDASQETASTTFTTKSDDDGKTVEGTATTVLNTLIMRIFGYKTINVTVNCASSMGVGNADVMMVLDNTGSMATGLDGGTRISVLQDAMRSFYATLAASTANSNARIRYGFVPYSTTVNVGRLLYNLDPDYLADSYEYQSRDIVTKTVQSGYQSTPSSTTPGTVTYSTVATSSSTKYSNTSYTSSNCGNNVPADDAYYNDYGTASTSSSSQVNGQGQNVTTTIVSQPQRQNFYTCTKSSGKYYVYTYRNSRTKYTTTTATYEPNYVQAFDYYKYLPVTRDTSKYKAFTTVQVANGSTGGNVSYTWNGCIIERKTTPAATFKYNSSDDKITPVSALDVDIDTPPDSTSDSKWAPMWPQLTYKRYDSWGNRTLSDATSGSVASSSCPVASQGLQEMDEADFDAYANTMKASGSTYLDIGMIWGARMISPSGIFADTVNDPPANGGEVSRHLIFMTDGIMDPDIDTNVAWGVEWWDRKVTANGSQDEATQVARHTQRFLAVCEALKAKGVRIWAIAFTAALSNDLKTCASDNSSYVASNSAQLNTAFQEIAKKVGELRLTH